MVVTLHDVSRGVWRATSMPRYAGAWFEVMMWRPVAGRGSARHEGDDPWMFKTF